MSTIISKILPTRRSVKFLTALLLGLGVLTLGAAMETANAQGRGNDGRGHDGQGHAGRGNDGRGHYQGNRGYHSGWNGGYYRAPPIIYGSPYGSSYYGAPRYYPPPVIYGPPLGFSFQIR